MLVPYQMGNAQVGTLDVTLFLAWARIGLVLLLKNKEPTHMSLYCQSCPTPGTPGASDAAPSPEYIWSRPSQSLGYLASHTCVGTQYFKPVGLRLAIPGTATSRLQAEISGSSAIPSHMHA